MSVTVTVEPTRNEDSVVFILDKTLLPPGTGSPFSNPQSAKDHPLARALFEIRGVSSLWILGNEVTVTKDPGVSWGGIKAKIVETIKRVES